MSRAGGGHDVGFLGARGQEDAGRCSRALHLGDDDKTGAGERVGGVDRRRPAVGEQELPGAPRALAMRSG